MSASEDRYHTFWPRFCAALIDTFVLLPLYFLGEAIRDRVGQSIAVLLVDGLLYSLPILYSVLLHAKYGKTLGKMAVRVTVMDVSEQAIPSLRQAAMRDIGYIALNMVGFFALIGLVLAGDASIEAQSNSNAIAVIGYAGMTWGLLEIVSMLTNEKRRAVHDFIAKTVVVRDA